MLWGLYYDAFKTLVITGPKAKTYHCPTCLRAEKDQAALKPTNKQISL